MRHFVQCETCRSGSEYSRLKAAGWKCLKCNAQLRIPPTLNQLEFAASLGIERPEGFTAGELSKRIKDAQKAEALREALAPGDEIRSLLRQIEGEGDKAFLMRWTPAEPEGGDEEVNYFFAEWTTEQDVRRAVFLGAINFDPNLRELVRRFTNGNA